MADKIVVLRDGYIQQVGKPLDLYNHPANRFVAGFIGSPRMNFLDGTIAATGDSVEIEIDGKRIKLPGRTVQRGSVGDPVTLGVRPEHLRITGGEGMGTLGTVRRTLVESLGGQTLIYARTEGSRNVVLALDGQVDVGENVPTYFDPALAHLFDPEGNKL